MSVSCECCVLSGRGLCEGLIPRPEESYRVWCVLSVIVKPWLSRDRCAMERKDEIDSLTDIY